MRQSVKMTVYGTVQGVFFRESTVNFANSHALVGTVRNMPDGTVEIIAEGRQTDIQALIQWAKSGPPHAQVTAVDVDVEDCTDSYKSFTIIR